MKIEPLLSNKKVRFNYEIIESIEAGIQLKGCEVKSIRLKDINFNDSYVEIENNECFLIGFYIGKYKNANIDVPDPLRSRKLLLTKNEIIKLKEKKEAKGISLIPLDIYFKGPYVKFNVGICRGKKQYDKRESLKQKDLERERRTSNG